MMRREGVQIIAVFVVALLLVVLQTAVGAPRRWLGAQPDLLPCLMVYCGLCGPLALVAGLAVAGGFWFDALSANPPGISVFPLLALGATLHQARDFILRDSPAAQAALGAAAAAAVPLAGLLLLRGLWPVLDAPAEAPVWAVEQVGRIALPPPVGGHLVRHALVGAAAGALATPVLFRLFRWIGGTFAYPEAAPGSFRPDRQIVRGRS